MNEQHLRLPQITSSWPGAALTFQVLVSWCCVLVVAFTWETYCLFHPHTHTLFQYLISHPYTTLTGSTQIQISIATPHPHSWSESDMGCLHTTPSMGSTQTERAHHHVSAHSTNHCARIVMHAFWTSRSYDFVHQSSAKGSNSCARFENFRFEDSALARSDETNFCFDAGVERCALEGDECAGHALVLGALLLLQDEAPQLDHAVPVELRAHKPFIKPGLL